MAYVPKELLRQAREMDLLTYLQLNKPAELIRISNNNYCTREHDSLKISNGKWYWFSRGFGGISALDYLVKVKEYTIQQAVTLITGTKVETIPKKEYSDKTIKQILLPEHNSNNYQVVKYLRGRGIHPAVIQFCLDQKILYESKEYHNAVFIGKDEKGKTRYAALRGTIGTYKGEATGSDKHYSFRITQNGEADHLHVFESAIDLMSYASLLQMKGQEWTQETMLSLAGVFMVKRDYIVPAALQTFLNNNPKIKTIHLHLDNDDVGRGAARGIISSLSDRFQILDEPPKYGKDINEQLMMTVGLIQTKKEAMAR